MTLHPLTSKGGAFVSKLGFAFKGSVAKYAKSKIEFVGAIINRPRADNIRPYVRRT